MSIFRPIWQYSNNPSSTFQNNIFISNNFGGHLLSHDALEKPEIFLHGFDSLTGSRDVFKVLIWLVRLNQDGRSGQEWWTDMTAIAMLQASDDIKWSQWGMRYNMNTVSRFDVAHMRAARRILDLPETSRTPTPTFPVDVSTYTPRYSGW